MPYTVLQTGNVTVCDENPGSHGAYPGTRLVFSRRWTSKPNLVPPKATGPDARVASGGKSFILHYFSELWCRPDLRKTNPP